MIPNENSIGLYPVRDLRTTQGFLPFDNDN